MIEYVSTVRKKLTPISVRDRLLTARQGPKENFQAFASRLSYLSLPCKLGSLQDSICRDVFVMSLKTSHAEIAEMLHAHPRDLSLEEVVVFTMKADEKLNPRARRATTATRAHSASRSSSTTRVPSTKRAPSAKRAHSVGRTATIYRAAGSSDHAGTSDSSSSTEDPGCSGLDRSESSTSTVGHGIGNTGRPGALVARASDHPLGSQTLPIRGRKDGGPPYWQVKFSIGLKSSVTVLDELDDGTLIVCHTKNRDEVRAFAKTMNEYYSNGTHGRVMEKPKVGMTCAIFFKGNYCRAKILRVDHKRVSLRVVDFGTVLEVEDNNVLFIPKQFIMAPRHLFPIQVNREPALKIQLEDILEVRCLDEQNGVFLCDVMKCADGPNRKGDIDSTRQECGKTSTDVQAKRSFQSIPGAQSSVSSPVLSQDPEDDPIGPVSFNKIMAIEIVSTTPPGRVFAVLESQMEYLRRMLKDLAEAEKVPLPRAEIGSRCLAPLYEGDSIIGWHRAKISKVNKKGTKAEINYIDHGGCARLEITQLKKLPERYSSQDPLVSEFVLPEGFDVQVGSHLVVKRSSLNDLGALVVEKLPKRKQVKFQLPDAIAAQEGSDLTLTTVLNEQGSWAIKLAEEVGDSPVTQQASPQPLPPFLPPDSYTDVRVLYVGPEGAFAAPFDKLEELLKISQQVAEVPHCPLQTPPAVGQYCIAPYDNGLYRARVLSINQQDCRVYFVDFGNECDLPIDQLREIPIDLAGNIYTFKIAVDPSCQVSLKQGSDVAVQPIMPNLELDGTCLVRVSGDA